MRRAGDGGNETPEVFNLMIDFLLAPTVQRWNQQGVGYQFDSAALVNAMTWADNLFLVAKVEEEAELMIKEISQIIYRAGFEWKLKDAAMMAGRGGSKAC